MSTIFTQLSHTLLRFEFRRQCHVYPFPVRKHCFTTFCPNKKNP